MIKVLFFLFLNNFMTRDSFAFEAFEYNLIENKLWIRNWRPSWRATDMERGHPEKG